MQGSCSGGKSGTAYPGLNGSEALEKPGMKSLVLFAFFNLSLLIIYKQLVL